LPAPLNRERLPSDPVGELARVYFDEIPDVFRRPNTRLYDWLGEQIAARGVRGILFWRRLFCDLWHAELDTMRRWSSVPVLDIDVAEGDDHAPARTLGRLEAFLEMLP
jgi:benzoyl-CoA reductase/2-hydroxyglutaryl-CoA dehydratase subunit BcrC/BadD/HgdB